MLSLRRVLPWWTYRTQALTRAGANRRRCCTQVEAAQRSATLGVGDAAYRSGTAPPGAAGASRAIWRGANACQRRSSLPWPIVLRLPGAQRQRVPCTAPGSQDSHSRSVQPISRSRLAGCACIRPVDPRSTRRPPAARSRDVRVTRRVRRDALLEARTPLTSTGGRAWSAVERLDRPRDRGAVRQVQHHRVAARCWAGGMAQGSRRQA